MWTQTYIRATLNLILTVLSSICPIASAQDTVRLAWQAEVPLGTSGYGGLNQAKYFTHYGVDGDENVYAASHASHESNIVVVKFSGKGNLLWQRGHSDFGLVWGDVRAMAVDSAGTTVLAGVGSVSPDTGGHGYLLSLNAEGDTNWFRWTKDLNPNGCEFMPTKLLIDGSGDIYYLGSRFITLDQCESFGFAIAKFYPNGDTAWVRLEHIPMHTWDRPTDIIVDRWNNVYITGTTYGGDAITNQFDYLVVRYQENGTKSWATKLDFSSNDEPYALAADSDSNVYVTGEIEPDSIGLAYGTVKLGAGGETIWTKFVPTQYRDEQGPKKIAIDGKGDIVICGGGMLGGEYSLLTIKYAPTGDTIWTRNEQFNGIPTGRGFDRAVSFDLDANNNIYVTGETVTPDSTPRSPDIVSLKYNASGLRQWVHLYDTDSDNRYEDNARFIAAGRNSAITVGGVSWHPYQLCELVFFKLEEVFRCGDVDGSGTIDLSDAVGLLQYLFAGGGSPLDLHSGDVNCDNRVNLTDAVYLIHFVFSGGLSPCEEC